MHRHTDESTEKRTLKEAANLQSMWSKQAAR
jgi:hypothetical protein